MRSSAQISEKAWRLGSGERARSGEVQRGRCDHFVQFYDSDEFLAEKVASYIGPALSHGEACIVIASASHQDAIERRIAGLGLSVADAKAEGRLQLLEAEATLAQFMREGWPDPALFQNVIGSRVKAAADGGRKVHAFGEMVAILLHEGNGEAALELERLWNDLIGHSDLALLCAYPLREFASSDSEPLFRQICLEHGRIWPSEAISGLPDTNDELLRAVAELQQRAASLDREKQERMATEALRQEQTRTLEVLHRVAQALIAEADLERVIQLVTDAGREICRAQFGAFFYNLENESGESYLLYTLSGASRDDFRQFPMPRNSALFAPTFRGESLIRLDDVRTDPRYGLSPPYHGMPPGHLPVRSYLAVPVISRQGGVLGGLFFGHAEAGVFTKDHEQPLSVLASEAAAAIENSKLQMQLNRELEALRVAKFNSQRLAAIVRSSDDAIISKDLNGVILTWNAGATRMFGYTEDEVVGQPITILFPPGHIDEEAAILSKIRAGERIEHYETQRRRKDGSIIDLSLSISPIFDEEGRVVGASKIARDISLRKRHEEILAKAAVELEERVAERTASLQEAVTQMEELSYTVSHDLRAPLRSMAMRCRMLSEDHRHLFAEDPAACRTIERLADQCAKLDRMVRDLLAHGRVTRGEFSLGPESLDEIVQDTIAHHEVLQSPLARLAVQGPLGHVIGHAPSLSQVVSNLLLNAVKFVPSGRVPEVAVWCERRDDSLRLWIGDNGIGIDPRYHHRLFSLFERIHPDLPFDGTGVGLAIVRRAVERMNGSVGVESDGIMGSRFWVELPRAE